MSDALAVGKKLVELCKEGKFTDAMNACYGDEIVSVEPFAMGGQSPVSDGIEAVRKKAEWWEQNNEVHSCEVFGPFPHGDRFIVRFVIEVTSKAGPTAGQRMKLDEAGLYTVKNGKVVHEEFFYSMG